MTTELTPAQQRILEQAAAAPERCVREFMQHMPSATQAKVLNALVSKGCVQQNTDALLYHITPQGLHAVGKAASEPTPLAPEITPTPTPERRVSKNATILDMLRAGTTIAALMQATGWQKHTVHGSISNLKKRHAFTLTSHKNEDGERIYLIA